MHYAARATARWYRLFNGTTSSTTLARTNFENRFINRGRVLNWSKDL
jgi:hypothetical protein